MDTMNVHSLIDRDTEQQKLFGQKMIDFETNMIAICDRVKNHINESAEYLTDEGSQYAINEIANMIDAIRAQLDGGITDMGKKQIQSAQNIEDAKDILNNVKHTISM